MENTGMYGVESFYDEDMDGVTIFHASPEDLEHDGENWVGSYDAYRLNCYPSLEEAIKNAGFWAPSIGYIGEFSEEEIAEIGRVTESLVTNEAYTEKFGRLPEKDGWKFKNICLIDIRLDEPELDS